MKFSVALAQLAPKLGNFPDNLEAHLRWVEKARVAGAHLVVFPELSLTGYILQDLVPDIAVPLPDATRLQPLLAADAQVVSASSQDEICDVNET
jgi:NAD+ synthase (glutamine-hydrolysing)